MRKPFFCAPAEELPFSDGSFDGIWSYAVLDHVDDPDQTLREMCRVLKPGGILLLASAWPCLPWAGRDSVWKPAHELSWPDRICQALIPVREALRFRAMAVFARRLVHLSAYCLNRTPVRLHRRSLRQKNAAYHVVDADARQPLDPFDAILWFRFHGDHVLSHSGWWRAFTARTGALVIERGEE